MATYKLIQDIEAEDHILGPLSLRQFIFSLIAAFLLYLCFIAVTKHVTVLLVILLPPALFCAFFAFPWGRDQPTETWALAKLRFLFKPRRRIWNQSGIKELVTITAPKKVERVLTDSLSQAEVKSRLQALANTIDSRGWAIKHINSVGYVPTAADGDSDRLINIPDVPAPQTADDLSPDEDVMDTHSTISRQFETMINKSTDDYRQRLVDQLQQPAPAMAATPAPPQQWFASSPTPLAPAQAAPMPAVSATAGIADTPEDEILSEELKRRSSEPAKAYGNLRTLQPFKNQPPRGNSPMPAMAATQAPDTLPAPMTAASDPAILSLSKNNDLNVSTIAREAQRSRPDNGARNEVVISLH